MLNCDVVVIGAGVNGLAAALSVHRRRPDARVTILERFAGPAPHRASSHGHLRITRSAYPNAAEVRGMFRALEEWRRFESELGTTLVHFRPVCLFGPPNGEIESYAAAIDGVIADTPELAVRRIDAADARRRFPQFRFANDTVVLDDRTGGIILAAQTIRGMVDQLTASGVEIRYDTRVVEIERNADGYRAATSNGDVQARQLVVAAGPWLDELVPCPPGRVTPIRQTVGYVRVEGLPTGTVIDEFPGWAHLSSGPNPIHYGLPAYGGQGLKVSHHISEAPATDLESDVVAADSDAELEILDFVREHLAVTSVELLETERCMYTCGEGDRFVVDWLDDSRQGVVVGAGSGHMFKWAPFIGRIAAEMLVDGAPGSDEARALLPFWSL